MAAPHPRALGWLVSALVASAGARAEGGADLRFSANAAVLHDSNLFRLARDANALALIGRTSAAETVAITGVDARYDKAYGLQRLEANAGLNKYNYRNFNYLDFTAINYDLAWRWAATPKLRGNLTSTREQTLNNFVDFQGFNLRNLRSDTSNRFDASYELDTRWRLSAGLGQSARRNSIQLTQESDYRLVTTSLGARYVLASGSSIGYALKASDGTYTSNRTIPSPGLYDDRFRQADNDIQLTWAISRDSTADFRIGQRSRSYPNYGQRDFAGATGAATLNWGLSAKSALVAGWSRELNTFETADFNFTQTDRFSVGPVWQLGPKTTVRMQLAVATREFRGMPAGIVTQVRRDITRDASLSLDWQPVSYLSFNAALQNARRSSSLAGFDYNSSSINLNAQFSY